MGNYLVRNYMSGAPKRYVRAFLLGCIQPDRNPTTYVKGSIRSQWLRGHNWENARRYMLRVCRRLERRSKLRLLDYYALGKLIHYTTDAFTYAHNASFGDNLRAHNAYEKALNKYFSRYLLNAPVIIRPPQGRLMEIIEAHHLIYSAKPCGVHTDARFALRVCCLILIMLLDPCPEDAVRSIV
jgi:hypothetical protein